MIIRTILLLCFISTSLGFVYSQAGYVISPSSDVQTTIELNGYYVQNIDFVHDNSTLDSIELQWELLERNAPTPAQGWDYSYCDYNQCYLSNAVSGTMKKFGPDENGFLKVTLLAGSSGTGFFKFRVYPTGMESEADTVTFTFNTTLSVMNLEDDHIKLFPNPIQENYLNIQGLLPNSKVSITDLTGKMVFEKDQTDKSIKINDLDLNSGAYIINLFSERGELYSTRRLIVR